MANDPLAVLIHDLADLHALMSDAAGIALAGDLEPEHSTTAGYETLIAAASAALRARGTRRVHPASRSDRPLGSSA